MVRRRKGKLPIDLAEDLHSVHTAYAGDDKERVRRVHGGVRLFRLCQKALCFRGAVRIMRVTLNGGLPRCRCDHYNANRLGCCRATLKAYGPTCSSGFS